MDSRRPHLHVGGAHMMALLDPPANSSQDQQAVGRHYRVGQTHNVHVRRMFIKDSHDVTEGAISGIHNIYNRGHPPH
ncbi:hypothetical protein E2P81_ATG07459 [Venturia nashicola]|uniref:Uncharacterized protein n=1 Tax=Venturia nashicola TaxID=86259 RepID=A0A4Z1P708_9PEZI|nr:hypothetical protein E6O75_ATG07615 [Venturia nashicola]TLD31969.1 hypothetical protein E2P81_ATG07459 [Venturia nashicola]